MMKSIIQELSEIISDFTIKLEDISEKEFSAKPLPDNWSKKEVIGHLIDSAQNNLRRFICAQYESIPPKITYQQDFWVNVNQYKTTSSQNGIDLWRLINLQIVSVLDSMPSEKYTALAETSELKTVEWLAADYVKHLKHHLNQVIPESFNTTYP
jgi:DinB superfamily